MSDFGHVATVTMRGRSHKLYGDRSGLLSIDVSDSSEPFLVWLAKKFPKQFRRALASVGWWMRGRMQEDIYQGGPPGASWPELSRLTRQRYLDQAKDAAGAFHGKEGKVFRLKDPTPWPYGRLVKAIGYARSKAKDAVHVGWLSWNAARLAERLQEGESLKVTPRMRGLFAGADRPIPSGTIDIPARPVMAPFLRAYRPQIRDYMEKKIDGYLQRGARRYRRAA